MTDPSAQPPAPTTTATTTSSTSTRTAAKAAPAPAWRAADLAGHAARWNTTPAVVRAALKASGKDAVASPDEAQAIVDAYLKQDVVQLERDAAAARAKEAN